MHGSYVMDNPENCKNCSSKCAYDCASPVHHTTQNSSDNCRSYLQTWCEGKTVRSLEDVRVPYLNALEMCSRQGAMQIHVYLILSYQTTLRAKMLSIGAKGMGLPMSET